MTRVVVSSKKNFTVLQDGQMQSVILNQPSIVQIGVAQSDIKSIIKQGNDLVITLKNGEKITLTKNEVLFLELLLEKPNHLISKNIIENSVFKASVDENTLRNMVYRLRKKIDTDTIATIKDLGYIIKIK